MKLQEKLEILNQNYDMLVTESKSEKGEQMTIEDLKYKMLADIKRYKDISDKLADND